MDAKVISALAQAKRNKEHIEAILVFLEKLPSLLKVDKDQSDIYLQAVEELKKSLR